MKNKLSLLELSVVQKILSEDYAGMKQLSMQVEECVAVRREFTGAGFFTYFEVSGNFARKPGVSFMFGDVIAEINGVADFAGFLLYVKDGVLECLEGYSFDGSWPQSVENFRLSFGGFSQNNWNDGPWLQSGEQN